MHHRGRSRNPRASELKKVRKDCRFHHKNLREPNKRTFLSQINRGHTETSDGVLPAMSTFLSWVIGGMYLLLPFFHIGFLEAAATRDPNGFPAARPFNHGCRHRKKAPLSQQRNKQKVRRWHGSHAYHEVVKICEGEGDVVGVVTPLRGVAQVVLHGDQIVELSVLLGVHQEGEAEEDGEGQVEVEREEGEVKEKRTCVIVQMKCDSRTS